MASDSSIRPSPAEFVPLLMVLLLCLPSFSPAADFSVGGYFDTGSRTQAEDYVEEDDDSEYSYRNYHLKFEHRLSSRARYRIGSFYYDKDYRSGGLDDTVSKIVTAQGSYDVRREKGEELVIAITSRYKEKRYTDSPESEYNQVVLSSKAAYRLTGVYSLYVNAGINSFDYVSDSGKDESRFFFKLGGKKYLLTRRLVIGSSFRTEISTRRKKNRRKNRNDLMLDARFDFDKPHIDRITLRVKAGQSDTRDDDGRDDDLEYTFGRLLVRTEHGIIPLLHTSLAYEYFTKDYIESDLDHDGFILRNTWKHHISSSKEKDLYYILSVEHKEVAYPIKSERDYRKESMEIKGVILMKRDWKTSLSVRGDFYDYRVSGKDKNRYYVRLLLRKYFLLRRLALTLHLKYKYTDNRHENDLEEKAGRLEFRYRF